MDTGTRSGMLFACKIAVFEVQETRSGIVRILLANLLQSSSSTFPWGNLLSFFAFQEGMLGTPIGTLEGWPTVSGRLLTRRDEESGPLHDLRYRLLPLRSLAALTAARVLFRTIQGGSPVERRGWGGAVCGSSISIIRTMRTRWATDPACIFCLI